LIPKKPGKKFLVKNGPITFLYETRNQTINGNVVYGKMEFAESCSKL
tara:strand:+ start:294 stop:434 length:141 start_codon:yes stop_codon:yes gene_type:complete